MLDAELCLRSPELPLLPEATAQGLVLAAPQSISRHPHTRTRRFFPFPFPRARSGKCCMTVAPERWRWR